ncbi:translation elongation factor Ts [Candidatus Galacturonibacter soehngenii]|uniref:Elongation factor Ts n=1 Tax=Candidatus Galacturonatibacter soehngenii TaxID=2307010 RepID=A0A7V7QJ95_9FIRM|nr:translation elongation factor Ts [Candidatus Galacturonibacter soehngenii]KAB1437677.1 elongation factor Ts [Candidatus Galacturonibacter soehngenii]MBA4686905.1 elongation factor Ts [Candidatus Galacturonibacter soehngenii]
MAITAAMVKELREVTGAGMMDCKKALNETNGDMEAAVEYLRKNGQAKAEKKSGRVAAEGLVKAVIKEDKVAAIVEVNSETDFVAKNDDFQTFVADVANQVLSTNATDVEGLLSEAWNADAAKTVKEALTEKIAIIGENLNIRRFEKITAENGCVVSYIHGGGRIGVLIEAETDIINEEIKAALGNVAMQVAALAPKYVSKDEVSAEYMEHEKEILKAQAKNENPDKNDDIIEKMIIGRLNKELKEVCLLDQTYVKDGDLTVAKYIAQVAKETGAKLSVKRFIRFETGEGIEKKEENFAEEVAKQMGQ